VSIKQHYLVGGFNPSEKYAKVSWDDYSQYMESHQIHVPNHQPVIVVIMNPSHHYGSQTIWMPVKSPLSEGKNQHLSSFVPNWLTIVCPKETRGFQ